MTNIIDAIINLVQNPNIRLTDYTQSSNRVNSIGAAFEEYIKDLFAGTFNMNETDRLEQHSQIVSYRGNTNNPPDIMLRGGDAIEVKKLKTDATTLQLNSSYPQRKLFSNSNMIKKACRKAESWTEKDIIYAVGIVRKSYLKHLCMVYGLDYCASEECYSGIKERIKEGVRIIPNIEFSKTKELGRVNNIDPLGITYLRVRGMWGIKTPWKVFDYIYERDMNKSFNFMARKRHKS